MAKVIYPDNITELLSKYHELEHNKIRERYEKLLKTEIENIRKTVENRFKNNIYDHETHCKALTNILTPFLRQEIENYELLYLEPLMYLKNTNVVDKDTPIWDFILGEIENNQLIRIIIGEVKTQKARSVMNRVEEAVNLYSKKETLDNLFGYIEKLFGKKKISFKRNIVKIEMVLVVQSSYYEDFEKSVIARQLKLNIWEIDPDLLRIKYTVKIHRWDKLLNVSNPYTESDSNFLKLLSFLKSKTFRDDEFISFTYSSDLNLVLDLLYKSYINLYRLLYSDSNLISLIEQAGGGNFYDDDRVIPDMVKRIKKLFMHYQTFKTEEGNTLFKQRIDINERIIRERMIKEIKKNAGEILFNQVIDELNPREAPKKHTLEKWLRPNRDKN